MSWVKIWAHLVFSTKNREPYLHSPELRKQVFQHIKQNAGEKGIYADCVNGYTDHTHCLISLGREQSISKVAQLLKGESSFWINQHQLTESTFAWQDDYWAESIGENGLIALRRYIYNQEEHHRKQSFSDEIKHFTRGDQN